MPRPRSGPGRAWFPKYVVGGPNVFPGTPGNQKEGGEGLPRDSLDPENKDLETHVVGYVRSSL